MKLLSAFLQIQSVDKNADSFILDELSSILSLISQIRGLKQG